MKHWILTLGLVLILGAIPSCTTSLDTGIPGELSVVQGAPNWPDSPATATHTVPATITSMANDGGTLILGTELGVYRMTASGLVEMELFIEPETPTGTGRVWTIEPRYSGVMVATENGLFHSYNQQLMYSPANQLIGNSPVNDLSITGDLENETLWLANSDGLFLLNQDGFDQVSFGSKSSNPVAVASNTSTTVVSFGSHVFELDIDSWTYKKAPAGLGNVTSVQRIDTQFYLASEKGLIRREPNGAYTLFTLSDAGNSEVKALGGNAVMGPLALTNSGITSVKEHAVTGLAPVTDTGTNAFVTADGLGNAWVGYGTQVTNLMVGNPVSFSEKVAPILETQCNSCHTTGYDAPVHDFGNYEEAVALADAIIQRISLGQMPPPPNSELTANDFDILVSWYATGMTP